jgi:hypothetical protein
MYDNDGKIIKKCEVINDMKHGLTKMYYHGVKSKYEYVNSDRWKKYDAFNKDE